VIFRPHPASFSDHERPVIDRICQLHADNPNFSLDANGDYTESYSLADLMVTDLSGTGFTFSFSFCRPTIFFVPDIEAERGLSGPQFESRHRIGAVVRNIEELIGKTAELCHRDMAEEIERFRDETVFNVGKSASYIVDCLEDILSGRERSEWVRL
jgi:CDP-glycerol glycerophosphotransferase (TagB/SpsB family)